MSIRNSAAFISERARWLLAAWLLFGTGLALAEPSPQPASQGSRIESFHLQHRSAREMMPLLRPLLDRDDGMSGTGYTLIVRSTPERLKEIADTIKQLDQAPTRLLITVRQGVDTRAGGSGADLNLRSGHLTLGRPHHGGDGADVRIYSTQRNEQRETEQQLQVSEGQWAHIATGQLVPLPEQSITATPSGIARQQTLRYHAFTSGFQVRPQLSGDTVTLQVRPFSTQPSPLGNGSYAVQSMSTTLSGRLGEWIPIGGQVQRSHSDGSGIVYSTDQASGREHQVFLKVERMP